jgi:hypothetical protein
MTKRTILHIGLPKTGTTSLQVGLRGDETVHYVHTPGAKEGQSRAVTKAMRPGAGESHVDWLAELQRTIAADPRTTIISDEALSKIGEVAPDRLAWFLGGLPGPVQGILVLRPFLSWLESLINQAAKNGNFDFGRFDPATTTDINGYPLNFEEVLGFYRDVEARLGGKMTLRAMFYNDTINDRLRRVIGLPGEVPSSEARNTSPRASAAFAMACRAAGIEPPETDPDLQFIGQSEAAALQARHGAWIARVTAGLGWDPRTLDDFARFTRDCGTRSYLAIGREIFERA